MVAGLFDGQAGHLGELGSREFGELRVRVDAGADGSAAEGDFTQLLLRRLRALYAALDLAGVTDELLAEPDRGGVLQMRAAGLDDAPELFGLLLQ